MVAVPNARATEPSTWREPGRRHMRDPAQGWHSDMLTEHASDKQAHHISRPSRVRSTWFRRPCANGCSALITRVAARGSKCPGSTDRARPRVPWLATLSDAVAVGWPSATTRPHRFGYPAGGLLNNEDAAPGTRAPGMHSPQQSRISGAARTQRLRLPIAVASASVPVGLCSRQCAPTAYSHAGWLAAQVLNGHAAWRWAFADPLAIPADY